MIFVVAVALIGFANCSYIPSPTGPRHGYLPRNESFRFHFDCTGWDVPRCDSAKAALVEVGELIATELFFYAPVVVCAKLSSVPVRSKWSKISPDYANTTMRSMYTRRRKTGNVTGPLITYPGAVVKQTTVGFSRKKASKLVGAPFNDHTLGITLDYLDELYHFDCDFDITFNTRVNWNIPGYSDQTSYPAGNFKFVAAKQITQGLGFRTNLVKKKVSGNTLIVPGTHYENDPNVTLINYMSPMDSITFSELEYPYVSLTHFITDQPPNIIRDEEPFSKTFGLFQQMGLYSRNGTEYRMNSSSTIQYMRIGKRLKSRIRRAYMQTRYISFITGAPMFKKSYFSDLLSNEGGRYYPDILMTPKGYLGGVALDWLIGTYGQGRIYGNSTLEVLETVGYATWRKPVTIEFSNTTFPSNP